MEKKSDLQLFRQDGSLLFIKNFTAYSPGCPAVESALLHHHLSGTGQWQAIRNRVAPGKKGP